MRRVLLALSVVVCLAMPVRAATEAQAVTSPGGIDAWLVQDDSIPLVTLNLYFPGGALLDPQGREGVTDMMVALMDDAAGDLDAAAYAATREGLPMRFSLGAGRNGISVSATILKRDLERCVAFLARTLSAPRFDEADIARLRPQLLSSLASSETEPGSIAGRAFRTRLFGDHPAGRPVEGTTESISAITRADILSAHDRAFDPGEVLASAVGDISAQELGEVLDRLVRGLDGRRRTRRARLGFRQMGRLRSSLSTRRSRQPISGMRALREATPISLRPTWRISSLAAGVRWRGWARNCGKTAG